MNFCLLEFLLVFGELLSILWPQLWGASFRWLGEVWEALMASSSWCIGQTRIKRTTDQEVLVYFIGFWWYYTNCFFSMRNVSRWRNLKHFDNVTTIEYADGQVFVDILKVIYSILCVLEEFSSAMLQCLLPCIVQLLPKNDPLIHCIRAYTCYRMMIGMHCVTEERIQRLKVYIQEYQHWCTVRISQIILSFLECLIHFFS